MSNKNIFMLTSDEVRALNLAFKGPVYFQKFGPTNGDHIRSEVLGRLNHERLVSKQEDDSYRITEAGVIALEKLRRR